MPPVRFQTKQPSVLLEKLAPFEEVRTVGCNILVLDELDIVLFRVKNEEGHKSLSHFERLVENQPHLALVQSRDHLFHVCDNKCDVGNTMPFERPLGEGLL